MGIYLCVRVKNPCLHSCYAVVPIHEPLFKNLTDFFYIYHTSRKSVISSAWRFFHTNFNTYPIAPPQGMNFRNYFNRAPLDHKINVPCKVQDTQIPEFWRVSLDFQFRLCVDSQARQCCLSVTQRCIFYKSPLRYVTAAGATYYLTE